MSGDGRWTVALVMLAGSLLLTGCADSLGGSDYSRRDARQAYRVLYGEVAGVNPVRIEGEATGLGTAGGAAIGYSLGRVIGDGDSGRLAGAVAGTAGAVAGREIEKSLTAEDGLEITVRLDGGETLLIVQSADVAFRVGERVRVLRGQGAEARVLKN
jgi:outer membrane lipoprotein SlyB